MYCAFTCIWGVYGNACCTWAISVRPLTIGVCPGDVLGGVTEVAPASVETEWGSVTSVCRERPERLDEYGGGAVKYAGRGVSSVYCGMGSPSGPTSPPFRRFRLSHHRKMRNTPTTPNAIPPNTPPTIAPVIGAELPLPVLAIDPDCANESLAVLVESGTTRETAGEVLMRVVTPATVV